MVYLIGVIAVRRQQNLQNKRENASHSLSCFVIELIGVIRTNQNDWSLL